MICKKCKKECSEEKVKNGICQDCVTKNNNIINIGISVVISVVIAVVLNMSITIWANSGENLSDFKVESFNMETEKTTYTYSSNESLSYTGKGTISCRNKNSDYIVLVEEKDIINNKVDYIPVIVHNGLGELSTYDSSYSGTTQKPEYEFNIIGYKRFNKE